MLHPRLLRGPGDAANNYVCGGIRLRGASAAGVNWCIIGIGSHIHNLIRQQLSLPVPMGFAASPSQSSPQSPWPRKKLFGA